MFDEKDDLSEYELAEQSLELGQYGRAVRLLGSRLNHNPSDYNAMTILARVYLEQKNLSAARQQINSALQLRPHNLYARTVHGLILAAEGQLTQAAHELDHAIKADPACARHFYFRALFLLEYRHDPALARCNILRAINLSGQRAVFHALLGRIFRIEAQLEYARLAYQRASYLAPDNQTTRLILDTLPPVEPTPTKLAQADLPLVAARRGLFRRIIERLFKKS